MYYAIIYNSDEEWSIGQTPVHKGDLLGYTEFPNDECFKDKPFDFIPVENIDMILLNGNMDRVAFLIFRNRGFFCYPFTFC